MITTDLRSRFSLKGFRSCKGMEGDSWSATLCLDRKPVAEVDYGGDGGSVRWRWLVPGGGGGPHFYGGGMEGPADAVCPAGVVWRDFVLGLPPDSTYGKPLPVNDDMALDELIGDAQEAKKLGRLSKGNVVFRLAGDARGAWRMVGLRGVRALSAEQRAKLSAELQARHGAQLERFYEPVRAAS